MFVLRLLAVCCVVLGALGGGVADAAMPSSSASLVVDGELSTMDGSYSAPVSRALIVHGSAEGRSLSVRVVSGAHVLASAPGSCSEGHCRVDETLSVPLDELPEGSAPIRTELLGDGGVLASRTVTLVVDRSAPKLSLSGPLLEAATAGSKVGAGDLGLSIDASDEGPGAVGVAKIEVSVNDAEFEQPPFEGLHASMTREFVFRGDAYNSGPLQIVVRAVDGVGNSTQQSMTVKKVGDSPECRGGALATSASQACPPDFSPCTAKFGTAGGAVAPPGEGAPQRASRDVEAAVGDLSPEAPADAGWRPTRGGWKAIGADAPAALSLDPRAGMAVGLGPKAFCLIPQDIAANARDFAPEGSTMAAVGTEPSTDTVARASKSGIELFKYIRSSDAPESFAWRVAVGKGQELHLFDDHTVAVTDGAPHPNAGLFAGPGDGSSESVPSGSEHATLAAAQRALGVNVRGLITANAARDAQGRSVPVYLTLDGDMLTMHVDHRKAAYAYPIIADPAAGSYWLLQTLTWNVLGSDYNRYSDNWLPIAFPAQTVGHDLYQTWLPGYGSDVVIGLQETCFETVLDVIGRLRSDGVTLAARADPENSYTPARTIDGHHLGACTHVITTLYPPGYANGQSALRWVRTDALYSGNAGCTSSDLKDNHNGGHFQSVSIALPTGWAFFANSHLRQSPYTYENEAHCIETDASRYHIMLGDFNILPNEQPLRYLRDNYHEVDDPANKPTYNASEHYTTPLGSPTEKKDYIFAKPQTVVPFGGGQTRLFTVSDHVPLYGYMLFPGG